MCINPQIGNLIPAKCQAVVKNSFYCSVTGNPVNCPILFIIQPLSILNISIYRIRSDYKCKHTMQNSVFCRKDI